MQVGVVTSKDMDTCYFVAIKEADQLRYKTYLREPKFPVIWGFVVLTLGPGNFEIFIFYEIL